MNLIFKSSVLAITLAFFSCSNDEASSFENESGASVTMDLSGEQSQFDNNRLVVDENNPLNKYSRIDSTGIYGFGVDYMIPDSLKNCDLSVKVSGKWRESESISGNIAFCLYNVKDTMTFFKVINASNSIQNLNTWTNFTDSLVITKEQNTSASRNLRMFSGKSVGKGFFDVDDLKIEINKK